MSRIKYAAASLAACGLIAALAAAPASAKTTTLHFFSKDVYMRVSDSSGKPVASNSFAVGDRLSIAANDYAGNHKHHAKAATASDHIVCTITGKNTGLCDGTIALGGAMIVGDDFVLNFGSNAPTSLKITGGTGRYRHAHGSVVAKGVTNNTTDLTVKVTT